MPGEVAPYQVERLDLHCHTTWSSGFCSPQEVVRWASMGDIRTLAITDHHHAEAYREAADLAGALGVTLIPAIELDCLCDGRRVDLLGYWIDPSAPDLRSFLARWPSGTAQWLSDDAALATFAAGFGVTIKAAQLQTIAAPRAPSLYDLFVLLVGLGWAPTLGGAFRRWEAMRTAGQLPRPHRRYASVEEGAAAIRASGGVVSLAHPALVRDDATVERLLAERVVDAIEAPYAS
jgi:predicted metal-dependent phosphoesterase TrpH